MHHLLELIAVGLWSTVCLAVCIVLAGFFLAGRLPSWWAAARSWPRRIRAARIHLARHRLYIEEPAVVTPEPIVHPHDDLPEPIRQMLARKQKPTVDGRGRRWAEDVLHGETGMHPVVVPLAIAAAPVEARELESVVA